MDGNVDKSEEHQEQHNTVGLEDSRIWSSHEGGHKIDMGKYIFCNRSLNMKGIVAVGFDMDYTLAQYEPETFETMAYDATIKKLVYDLGYPPEKLLILQQDRAAIEDRIHHISWSLRFKHLTLEEKQMLSKELNTLESQKERVRCLHQQLLREGHLKFHKPWGQLMKTGYQNSRFAHQVERFACLYTSQVTNLGLYSPDKYYRPSEDFMPHEFDILRQ